MTHDLDIPATSYYNIRTTAAGAGQQYEEFQVLNSTGMSSVRLSGIAWQICVNINCRLIPAKPGMVLIFFARN